MTEIIKEKLKTIKGFGTITKLEISSLITTIESQKEEIRRLSTCQDCGGSGVNELCHDPYYVVPCMCTVDWYSENMELRKQIESLKAITELKNAEIDDLKCDIQRIFERADEAFADQPDNYALSIALTMIRKWSHERLNPKEVNPNAQT